MAMEQLKIKAGESARVLFPRDDVRYDVHQQYGKSWCYMVSVSTSDDALFGSLVSLRAYAGLQYALVKAHISKGMEAVIHRLPGEGQAVNQVVWKIDVHVAGDGKAITVKDWDGLILSPNLMSPDDAPSAPADSPAPGNPPAATAVADFAAKLDRPPASTSNAPPAASNGKGPSLAHLEQLTKWCVNTAFEAWGDRGSGDNIQGTSSTLLILAKGLNLWEQWDAAAQAPPTAQAASAPPSGWFEGGEAVPPPADDDLPF